MLFSLNRLTSLSLIVMLPLASSAAELSKVTVSSELVDAGRAMVTAERGNYMVVDSVPPLDGPNVAVNPTELMVGALATCATFVAKVTLESSKQPFTGMKVTAEGDFNPKNVKSGSGDTSFQTFRVNYHTPKMDEKTQKTLKATLPQRCPVYATLEKAAKIEVSFLETPAFKAKDGLATVSVKSNLSADGLRASVNSRNHHFIVDNVPPLGGKNETINPLDLIMAAQSTCVLFVAEFVSKKSGGEMGQATAKVTGHFDVRGVKGEKVSPRIQKMEVALNAPGLSADQKSNVMKEIKSRCPIFSTLKKGSDLTLQ